MAYQNEMETLQKAEVPNNFPKGSENFIQKCTKGAPRVQRMLIKIFKKGAQAQRMPIIFLRGPKGPENAH